MSIPRNMRSRASPSNLISLAAIIGSSWLGGFLLRRGLIEHAHDVGFFHDHAVLAIELHLGARPLSAQHTGHALYVDWMRLAPSVAHSAADRVYFPFHLLFLLRVG